MRCELDGNQILTKDPDVSQSHNGRNVEERRFEEPAESNGRNVEERRFEEPAESQEAGNEPTRHTDPKTLVWPCAPSCGNEQPASLQSRTKSIEMDHDFRFAQTDKGLVLIAGDNDQSKGECDGTWIARGQGVCSRTLGDASRSHFGDEGHDDACSESNHNQCSWAPCCPWRDVHCAFS